LEGVVALTFTSGFAGGEQSIGNAGHGGDDNDGMTLQTAFDDLRSALNGRGVHHRSAAKLHYDHETPLIRLQSFKVAQVARLRAKPSLRSARRGSFLQAASLVTAQANSGLEWGTRASSVICYLVPHIRQRKADVGHPRGYAD
jgi:hypothetical protein